MNADFLLELLSEEIPARMQEKAAADLRRLFEGEIAKAGLQAAAVEPFVTPRRLGLIARGLPLTTLAVSEEIKGPRADAPPQALAGFLGKTGLTRDQLVERTDAKGNTVLFAVIEKPGRPTEQVLAGAVGAVMRAFPWPKAMRWGAASASTEAMRWVRPLQGIVAILGSDLVDIELEGVRSGFETVGHRFHHPGPITIGGAHDYAAKLRACHVIVDAEERRGLVREGAARAAAAAGLAVVPDEGLVAENAGLTEWPVPLLGQFDPAFLAVPREVIQLTMRTNQKYFACVDGAGKLAPAFICTANIEAADGGAAIVDGNRKVLAARLSDARFFYETDLRTRLEERLPALGKIVFHEKLGTVADKVERVAKLARWLVEEGIVTPAPSPLAGEGRGEGPGGAGSMPATAAEPAESSEPLSPTPLPQGERGSRARLADMAEQAARLAKADLVSGMVGEFPELQGIMGGYYARAEGLPDEVADAIRDHYKPVGQGDEVPTAPVTVAVSLADKLDSLYAFFSRGLTPTGSRDPFALRRAALAVISLVLENQLRAPFKDVLRSPDWVTLMSATGADWSDPTELLLDFFADRLKVQQREAGVRNDLIDAVFALGGEDDLVRLLARVKALQAFVATEDGANLLAGYKRAANIVAIEAKKDSAVAPAQAGADRSQAGALPIGEGEMGSRLRGSDGGGLADEAGAGAEPLSQPSPTGGEGLAPAEAALAGALDRAELAASAAVEREAFGDAMAALASLRAPIDRFFDEVTVNDPDPAKRARRLALLARIRNAVHRVADFSRIEG